MAEPLAFQIMGVANVLYLISSACGKLIVLQLGTVSDGSVLAACVPGKDSRTIRTSASAEKIRRVQDALNIPTDGTDGPYTSTLQPGVLSQLNSREREKLDIEFGRLKVSGRKPFLITSRQMEEC